MLMNARNCRTGQGQGQGAGPWTTVRSPEPGMVGSVPGLPLVNVSGVMQEILQGGVAPVCGTPAR